MSRCSAALGRISSATLIALTIAATCVFAQNSPGADDDTLVGDFFPYRAFDKLAKTRIEVGGGTLEVAFGPGSFELPRAVVLDWVEHSVRAVAGYFGRLPDPKSRLLIVPVGGAGIRGGTTYGYHGAASRIQLGHDTTKAQLTRDWVLVHELVHQGLPNLADRHHWLEEGLATYVEPIARVQAGELEVEKVWKDLIKGLPYGLPRAGDEGLDHTHTWGRTYWGGALFYLLADIEIHRRTDNRLGLQDAMRAVVAAGGNICYSWPVERVLTAADSGTGVHVLTELYDEMKDKPHDVDLTALWQQLGVSMQGESIRFDDSAPLAAIRRAITAPRPAG
jgi:hypothetical protein